MLQIRSSRLIVGFEPPGTGYHGTRFDWTSGIVSVQLDGVHQFASAEFLPGDPRFRGGGRGFMCEFGISGSDAYDRTAIGAWFPKIGVGNMVRENTRPYDFSFTYRDLALQEYEWWNDGSIHVRAKSPRGDGVYAWTLDRTWKVSGNVMDCTVELHNQGEKAIHTDEYCHNFIRLGTAPVGPDYCIEFSFPVNEEPPDFSDPSGCLDGRRPVLSRIPGADFYLGRLLDGSVGSASWTLRDGRTGLGMGETLEGDCVRCALWGNSHVISPELFVRLDVAPQRSVIWKRSFSFHAP